ncbi:MAG: hypothetical protein JSW71_19910 [Gemmatimonadota bacterium]|nr:MAG: hypothetical protein JSW71_19910 [Gemmatimonadota bacterium]
MFRLDLRGRAAAVGGRSAMAERIADEAQAIELTGNGVLQSDGALVPDVALSRAVESETAGRANILCSLTLTAGT